MVRLVSAWVLVNAVLLGPAWIGAALGAVPAAPWLSLEAALLVAGMALLPRRPWSPAVAWILAVGLVTLSAASFGDLVFRQSLGRPLNLSLDLYLLGAVYDLALGNSGSVRTFVGIVGGLLVAGLLVVAVAWLLTRPDTERAPRDPLVRRASAGLAAAAAALFLLGLGVDAVGRRVTAPVASLLAEQAALFRVTREERVAFAGELEGPPPARPEPPLLLSRLEGRHVALVYIESYGMAALEDPELAGVVVPRLEAAAARLEDAGIHLVSGTLESPTLGGQSWYAHGSMLSGLWLQNQLRYELLLASDRETLIDDFRHAGYRTATVMPAITTAWPEAVRLGYDEIHTSQNIPYAGPPLYWVTMPDQFTWAFLAGLLDQADGPLFAEVGMVSSHAPWTPVLPLVDWDSMGDGSVFEPYRLEGYPPEETWWDVAVLREGYGQSLAYSLDAMASFAERFLDDGTLLIVSGDHQAAPWVTGAGGAEVPVHVMTRDRALVEPFLAWGFRAGALPDSKIEAPRMDEFRGWFLTAFSGGVSSEDGVTP